MKPTIKYIQPRRNTALNAHNYQRGRGTTSADGRRPRHPVVERHTMRHTPAGTYIVLGGERYTLLEPYSPEQRSEAEWKYSPQFESRTAIWTKKPFFLYATDDDGTVTSREPDFSFTGSAADFARLVIKAVLHETGESWTAEVDSELDGHKSLTFSATDIAGALSQIADTFGTEWLAEKTSNILYLGKAMLPTNDSEGLPPSK